MKTYTHKVPKSRSNVQHGIAAVRFSGSDEVRVRSWKEKDHFLHDVKLTISNSFVEKSLPLVSVARKNLIQEAGGQKNSSAWVKRDRCE